MRHHDEAYIEALLVHGSVSAVAEQLSVARTTVYRRLQDAAFKAKLEEARKEHFTVAIASVHAKLWQMLKRLERLAEHGKTEAIQLQATNAWIALASRHWEIDIDQAMLALEERKHEQQA